MKFQSKAKTRQLVVATRFRLLRAVLDLKLGVPRFAQGFSAEKVIEFARKTYRPTRVLQAKAVLIRPAQGEGKDGALIKMAEDPLFDWGHRINGGLEVFEPPGGHSSMLREPHVEELARFLIAEIERVTPAEVELQDCEL